MFAIFFMYLAPIQIAQTFPMMVAEAPVVQEMVLKDGRTIVVASINFSGNTSVTTAQLQNIARPFLNRPLAQSDLYALKRRVVQLYANTKYPNAKVSIPEKQGGSSLMVMIEEGKKQS